VIAGAATAVLCVVAASAVTVGSARAYALARGHGMDGPAAVLVAVSVGGLIVAASLVLLREARNGPGVPEMAENMLWLGSAVMAAADITSGARYGLLGAIIAAWPAVAFFGTVEMALELVHRARRHRHEASPAPAPAASGEVKHAVRVAYLASVQAGQPLSQRTMAARFGLSRHKIRQLVPESTMTGNDHRSGGETA
jgi:hypothetical protein